MRMKMYTAETLDEARRQAFAELGDEAIVLSEKKTETGFQIRAAVNKSFSGVTNEGSFANSLNSQALAEAFKGPAIQRLRDTLSWHGISDRTIRKLIRVAAKHVSADYSRRFDDLLADVFTDFCKFSPRAALQEKNIILVGPPGHGRTACLAKLARQAHGKGQKIIPIAADLDATAGAAQLRAYLENDKNSVQAADTPKGLFNMLKRLDAQSQRYIIDLPAIVPFDDEDLARLSDLLAVTNAEPILVISAEGHPEDLLEITKRFAGLGIKKSIVTKIDMTQRRGGIVSALALSDMELTYLSSTPFIGLGLVGASPSSLASLFLDESEGEISLRGAA